MPPRQRSLAVFTAVAIIRPTSVLGLYTTAPSSLRVGPRLSAESQSTLGDNDDAQTPDSDVSRRRPFPTAWRNLKLGVPKRIGLMVEPTPFTHVSGYSNRFNEMLRYLSKAGDAVEIVTPDNGPTAPTKAHGFNVNNIPGFSFPMYPLITLALDVRFRALSLMRRFKPEILHVSTPGFLCGIGVFTSKLLGVPLVMSYHTHLPVYARNYANTSSFFRKMGPDFCEWLSWKVIRAVHSLADLTLVTSPQMKAELTANGVERVEIWRKGIDTQRFNPRFRSAEARARLTAGHPEAPLLIYVGRLAVEKRLRHLKAVLARHPGARLAFVGAGPAEAELKEYFAGTPCVFTGQLSGDDLSAAFASADIFVMPSDSETLGFVVLEAMASGVPVVGARAGGIPSIIADGTNGFLASPGDADDFAAKVGALLESPEARAEMGAAARAEAERWDWESATAHLRNVQYTSALENFKTRPSMVATVGRYCRDRATRCLDAFSRHFVVMQPAPLV